MNPAWDPITLEIVRGALRSVQREMDALVERTAMSPFIREKKDYYAAIYDAQGRLVGGTAMPTITTRPSAGATSTPGRSGGVRSGSRKKYRQNSTKAPPIQASQGAKTSPARNAAAPPAMKGRPAGWGGERTICSEATSDMRGRAFVRDGLGATGGAQLRHLAGYPCWGGRGWACLWGLHTCRARSARDHPTDG